MCYGTDFSELFFSRSVGSRLHVSCHALLLKGGGEGAPIRGGRVGDRCE
jgi:hypothetical protein